MARNESISSSDFHNELMLLQRFLTILLCSALPVLFSVDAGAQQPEGHSHRIMQDIEAAYHNGRITLDQKVLYKFYAGLQREKLPSQFITEGHGYVKCGTPAYLDFKKHKHQLSQATVAEIEKLTESNATQAQETYLSPSGMFLFHYETSGSDAVPLEDNSPANGIPDYVELAGIAADSSWRHQVATLNYTDPIIPGEPYDIYFKNFSVYGLTSYSSNSPTPCDINDKSCIYIHNNFQNFPPNTDPEGNVVGALKVTVAHELKHAIQYEATAFAGSPKPLCYPYR